jgi:hypothetical protein
MESIASKDTNGEQVTPGIILSGLLTNSLVANKPTAIYSGRNKRSFGSISNGS